MILVDFFSLCFRFLISREFRESGEVMKWTLRSTNDWCACEKKEVFFLLRRNEGWIPGCDWWQAVLRHRTIAWLLSHFRGLSAAATSKRRKSPTLIVHVEFNCSLICNFFVHRLDSWQGKSQKCVSLQWLSGPQRHSRCLDFLISTAKVKKNRLVWIFSFFLFFVVPGRYFTWEYFFSNWLWNYFF